MSQLLEPGALVRKSCLHFHPCNAAEARPSQVLVSGANGFVGSHICDQLLSAGYRVRGTVRSIEKQAWLQSLFDKRHASGRFELAQVEDITQPGCYEAAIKGPRFVCACGKS